jgi:hypothetical protein
MYCDYQINFLKMDFSKELNKKKLIKIRWKITSPPTKNNKTLIFVPWGFFFGNGLGYNTPSQFQPLFCDKDFCDKIQKNRSTRTKVITMKQLCLQIDDSRPIT